MLLRRLSPILLLVLAFSAGYALLERDEAPTAPSEPPPLPEFRDLAALPPPGVPAELPSPKARAEAPETGSGRYGFCPDEEGAPLVTGRPPLASLLSLEAAELMDQVRSTFRSGQGSQELRRGLTDFLADQDEGAIARLERAPDRLQSGFDYAAAATIVLAMQALNRGQAEDAARLAKRALLLAPQSTAAHVLSALSARAQGAMAAERQALERAYALSPDEPSLALSVGEAKANTTDLTGAIAALTAYLESTPEDIAAGQLRERVTLQAQLLKNTETLKGAGISLRYPGRRVPRHVASLLHEELDQALTAAAALTGLPRRDELLVVVYDERSDLIASTCVPNWTEGVFDGTLRLHAEAVMDPERRLRVVRHEAFHAQLRSQPIDAPHWFHEGAAQFFASEMGPSHAHSFRRMLKQQTYIPFPSMEGSFIVIDGGEDARLAYHQSLAMVQMLISERGENGIAEAVAYLQHGGEPSDLFQVMLRGKADRSHLMAHLRTTLQRLP